MFLVIIECLIFFGYLTFIVIRFGMLDSISKSYYKLNEGNRNQGWMFTVFICALGVPLFTLEVGWFFYAGAGLFFTGIAAEYKEKLTSTVHYCGTAGCIALAATGLAVEDNFLPVAGLLTATFLFWLCKISNRTTWVEINAFVFIILGLANRFNVIKLKLTWQNIQQLL